MSFCDTLWIFALIGGLLGGFILGVASRQKWAVQICCNYQKYTLGRFDNLEKAVLAYNKKAKLLFGEFAVLNFPGGEYEQG
jgi:hypothetical protein